MDLRTMLNESTAHKHAPTQPSPSHASHHGASLGSQSALDRHVAQPRDTPFQPPPLQPLDSRSSGSYFPAQSPYQQHNPAATPIANGNQRYAQSPAIQGGPHTPYFGNPPPGSPGHISTDREQQLLHEYHQVRASGRAPDLQWPDFLRQAVERHIQHDMANRTPSSHPSPPQPAFYNQPAHMRQNSTPIISPPYPQPRSGIPSTHLQSQPGTPLGPPGPYSRPSPQTQRPISQGYDHYRKHSSGSVSSQFAQEQSARVTASPQQQTPTAQLQRQYSVESERERSQSVSPKTIPQPLPPRQASTESSAQTFGTPGPPQQIRTISNHSQYAMPSVDSRNDSSKGSPTPISSATSPNGQVRGPSQPPASQPSPAAKNVLPPTPKFTSPPPPNRELHQVPNKTSLKRSASNLSGSSSSAQSMRKRLRRDEVPVFAQSARKKPVKLTKKEGAAVMSQPMASSSSQVGSTQVTSSQVNGYVATNGNAIVHPVLDASDLPREPSITNQVPYEDLTRQISDWIVGTIGMAEPPSGGAMFEIEAKIGDIHDIEEGQRLNLPVLTETVFNKEKFRKTKFESSMNMAQHKKLNEFLNKVAQDSHQTPARIPIQYDHRRESDQFYELTPDGVRSLPPSIIQWTKRNHRPRVRITSDLDTLAIKARIIKSRIADLEIYNPGADFDYRISISIESPWDGNNMHLTPLEEQGAERNKDRVSYRHMAYQIDLTQVSYPNSTKREHELEVEISTEQIRLELGNLKAGRPARYEELVRGFVDNVRILCRQGTLPRR